MPPQFWKSLSHSRSLVFLRFKTSLSMAIQRQPRRKHRYSCCNQDQRRSGRSNQRCQGGYYIHRPSPHRRQGSSHRLDLRCHRTSNGEAHSQMHERLSTRCHRSCRSCREGIPSVARYSTGEEERYIPQGCRCLGQASKRV
jgi:hypothetical protein